MNKIEMYQCEICKSIYLTKEEAITCESRGKEKPIVKIGDKIKVDDGFWGYYVRVVNIHTNDHFVIYELKHAFPTPWRKWTVCGNDVLMRNYIQS